MKKVVIITGASNGIGANIAKSFALAGYCVVINYNKSKQKAEELANELSSAGHTAISYQADVSDFNQVNDMIKYVLEIFGHIDVLINNAGVCSYKILIDENIDSITKQINTNLLGTIVCSQVVSKQMIKQNFGKIINIASIWGICGASGETVYSATKGGIITFTKALAKELAYSNVTVNAISPGVVDTDMINHLSLDEKQELINEIPLGRLATTEDISNCALFLASDKANYITGQNIQVDGGFAN